MIRARPSQERYIKSRFLDDKLSVGILLGYARYLKEENVTPERMIYQHITSLRKSDTAEPLRFRRV